MEILFRLFENDKMLYQSWQNWQYWYDTVDCTYIVRMRNNIEPEPMLYVGLCDRNGKKMFEEDIVKGCCFNGSYRYGIIKRYREGFCVIPIGKFAEGIDHIDNKMIEVVGNIYQNKELLKQE